MCEVIQNEPLERAKKKNFDQGASFPELFFVDFYCTHSETEKILIFFLFLLFIFFKAGVWWWWW